MSNLPGTRNQEIGETPSQHVMISIPAEGEVNEKLLLHSLMEEVPKLLKKSAGKNPCSIFRVPQSLLKIHPEAFHPQIVSIGPYHHGKEHLQMIQEHKRRFLDAALSRAQEFGNGFDDFYKAIAKKKEKIREYYSESTDKYSDHELIEMMIVDGCFIIEVLCIAGGLVQFEEGDSIFSLPWIPFSLMRDFVRLENQIPIFVLENLYELSILASEAEDLPSLTELILKFFDHTFSRPEAVLEKYKNLGGKHLLDLFRSTFVQDLKQPQEVPKDVDHGEFLRLIQPVAKLQVAGVEINPSSPAAESFLDIKFRRYGVLEIPHLSIDEFFSTFLINCVAFEQCYKHGSTHFTSYVIFMSCLNNAPIDAGYLRDRKIIENFFGTDKELVKFFNQVTMSEEKEHEDAIQDLMSKAIEILIFEDKLAFDKSNEDYAQMAFEELIELTKERPDLFLPHLKDMFQCIYQILDNSEFEEKTRFLAEELMVLLLLHYRDEKPVLLRTGKFISQILSRLQDIDDDPSWDGNDNFDDDSRVFVQGVKRLAQYAPAIGGQFILEKFKIMFDFNFFSEKWQSRHAAVISCSIIARNCPKESINELDLLVEQPMKAVDDTHFRVRWAAINAIQEFSKNLNPDFQFQYYKKVLPALTKALNFSSHPYVQVQAASALFYFSNDCTSGLLTPYMDEIVNKLLRCLQRGKQLLKEEALTAVGSLVSSSEDHFQVYYKTVMPHLKVIMMKAAAESNSVLLRKSIECITMVGLAVGKKMFSDDIQMVVQSLISLQESKLERGDPMRNQVLRAWGRLCKCLGQDFQPYLGVVIPHLLQSAQLESRVTSPKYTESKSSFQSVISPNLGDDRTEIKEQVIEEKAVACKVLFSCATELMEGFDLWIDEVAQTLVPLISFDLNEQVREVSVSAMPVLLNISKASMEKGYVEGYQGLPFEELCFYTIPALVEALHKEPSMEIQLTILDSLEECMEMSGPTLKTEQIKRFLHIILEILITSSTLSRSRVEYEQIEKIHITAGDCLITFTEVYKASLSQFFDQLLSCMAYMWENDKNAKERRTAFRIFSDVAEKCQEEALKYCEGNLRFLFDACYERNPEVQQIVAKCIGVSAQFGGAIFKSHIKEALGGLNSIMRDPETLNPDYLPAHDAAVSALGKIYLFHDDQLNEAEVFGRWLSHLPLVNDLDQARVAHDQLCLMVKKFSEELIHNDNAHLSKVIAVFAEILWAGQNLASKGTVNRIIEQLEDFRSDLPPNTWASILSSLAPSRAKILQLKLLS